VEFVDRHPVEGRHRAVGQHDLNRFEIAVGLLVFQRVRAGGVVADTAAEDALVAPRRIGGVFEAVVFEAVVEPREGDPRLGGRRSGLGVDRDDLVEFLLEVQHDCLIDRLAGEAGAAAARQDGDPLGGTVLHDSLDVRSRCRNDDADRQLGVGAGVGRIQVAGVAVEPDLAVD